MYLLLCSSGFFCVRFQIFPNRITILGRRTRRPGMRTRRRRPWRPGRRRMRAGGADGGGVRGRGRRGDLGGGQGTPGHGMGGADCSGLQPMGTCYNPNAMQAHASYAFNSYFQRNPSPASCDFGGAGMLVATNPSSGACMYQTSSGSGGTGYTPAVTGTVPVGMTPDYGAAGMTPGYSTGPTTGTGPVGGGSGSTMLNANNNPGGTSMYGPDNPTGFSGASSGAASLSCGWVLSLILVFTISSVKEKVYC